MVELVRSRPDAIETVDHEKRLWRRVYPPTGREGLVSVAFVFADTTERAMMQVRLALAVSFADPARTEDELTLAHQLLDEQQAGTDPERLKALKEGLADCDAACECHWGAAGVVTGGWRRFLLGRGSWSAGGDILMRSVGCHRCALLLDSDVRCLWPREGVRLCIRR
ncbi:hypothetical protein [Streptomyces sp. NPDC057686]|uniref:hypothetical protein n=1 Tax=Streptomyces sp. NPDC057686 TaxID=3346212 RepID=UPI00369F68D4